VEDDSPEIESAPEISVGTEPELTTPELATEEEETETPAATKPE
jgi:hypothetical protein